MSGFIRRAGTKYAVAVFGMFDGGQSMPLAGEERTTLIDPPEPRPMDPPGKASFNLINIHILKMFTQENFTCALRKKSEKIAYYKRTIAY